jgi:hypothetical protein
MPSFFPFLLGRAFNILTGILVLIIIAGLSGCAPAPTTPQQTFEVIVPLPMCTPDSSLVNVYKAAPQAWANAIFEYAFPPYIPTPIPPNPSPYNEQQILSARYAAFQQLVNETKRWSDTQTINLQDSSKVSITLTHISPELLQAVFLNEVLENRFPTFGFQDQLQKVLNSVAARDELLFLLTVTTKNTSTPPTRQTIRIPINSMLMYNSKNISTARSHDDHNLEEVIDTSSDPVFGYLAYQLALISANQCEWLLDPKYNTNIALSVPFVEVNGVNNNSPVSWTIPYAPLIIPIMPTNTPVWNLPSEFDQSLMTPLTLPPNEIHSENNWQDFARFVWGQLTQGNY